MALRVWLPLNNGNLQNQGLNKITITNNNWVSNANGKLGSCYYSENGSHNCTISNYSDLQPSHTNSISICCWIKSTTNDYIVACSAFEFRGSASVQQFRLGDGNTNTYIASTSGAIAADTWAHVCGVWDAKNKKVQYYVNGVLKAETTVSSDIGFNTISSSFRLPYNGTNVYMNDFRIYTGEALSVKQIKEIAKGLVCHYKLDNFNNTNLVTSLQAGGHTTVTNNRIVSDGADADTYFWIRTSTLTQGNKYTFKAIVTGMPEGASYSWAINNDNNVGLFYLKNGLNVISFTCPSLNDFTKLLIDDKTRPSGWNTPITFSKIELIDSNGGSITDVSGNGYNGEIINGSPTFSLETPRYSGSTSFDGVNDAIQIPYNAMCPNNIFTVNMWFKKDSLGTKGYETLFGGPAGFEMDTRSGTSSTLTLYMASTRGGSAGNLTMGEWNMVTMVRDGSNEYYYINGALSKTIEAKAMPIGNYFIGAWRTKTEQNYYGLISDFRLYSTALSANDVLTLYQDCGIIDKKNNVWAYEFKEE